MNNNPLDLYIAMRRIRMIEEAIANNYNNDIFSDPRIGSLVI